MNKFILFVFFIQIGIQFVYGQYSGPPGPFYEPSGPINPYYYNPLELNPEFEYYTHQNLPTVFRGDRRRNRERRQHMIGQHIHHSPHDAHFSEDNYRRPHRKPDSHWLANAGREAKKLELSDIPISTVKEVITGLKDVTQATTIAFIEGVLKVLENSSKSK